MHHGWKLLWISLKLGRSTHKRSTGYYMLSSSFHFRPYRSSIACRQPYRSSKRTAHRTKKICIPGPVIYIYIYIHIYIHIYIPRPTYFLTFLGAFASLRKATVSFVMSVCLPSAWNNSAPTGRIFNKFYIWVFFENLFRKFKFNIFSPEIVSFRSRSIEIQCSRTGQKW